MAWHGVGYLFVLFVSFNLRVCVIGLGVVYLYSCFGLAAYAGWFTDC